MPADLSNVVARSRAVEIDGIGKVIVREPTLADYQRSSTDQFWWAACLSCPDGTPLVSNPKDLGTIRLEVAAALLEEVNRPRPSEPPSGGSSESQARSSA